MTSRAKRRVIMSRLGRLGDAESEDFDLRFWARVGLRGRLAAAWDMVREVERMRGRNGRQLRLQRSVAVLKRRRR
jgi:hypothetical protein